MKLLRPLRERDFALLWTGMTVSLLGDGIYLVAVAWQVYDLSNDPTALSLVGLSWTVGMVAFLLTGGIVSDRVERRRVMIGADLVRAGVLAAIAALALTGVIEVWHLVALVVLFGAGEAFFGPAFGALIPDVVSAERLVEANALDQLVRQAAARLAGPALGGFVVALVGAGSAFAIDAATFVVSAAFLVRMRPRERGEMAVRSTVLTELREGWTEVRSRDWIWVIILAFSVALLMSFGPWQTLGPTVSIENYDTRATFGIAASVLGLGTIIGAVIGFRWRPRHPMRAGMLLTLPWPVSLAAFALGLPEPLVLPLFLLDGIGVALFGIWWETALAERVPPHMLSRVTAYDWMGSLALLPLGYVLAGPIGEQLGAVEVLVGGSAVALLALMSSLLVRDVRSLTRLERV